MRSRPTVASPGAMASRTARATIQLPDQRRSVATRTSQAVRRTVLERRLLDAHAVARDERGPARDFVLQEPALLGGSDGEDPAAVALDALGELAVLQHLGERRAQNADRVRGRRRGREE